MSVISTLGLVIVLAIVAFAALYAARALLSGGSPMGAVTGLFGPKPDRRLDVVEAVNVDGRRRLLLVRRDGVEHLIMTGGPVDLVIETGIQRPVSAAPAPAPASTTATP